jgi:iron complex transport system ATP-binding protein
VNANPVLRVEDVDVVRDGNRILREVSLTVRAGEHWALLGANGAGKSTLLSLLGALAHPTRGTVEVLGHQLGRVDMRQLRSYVGHVNPRHDLRSPLKVQDVVLTGLTNTIERVPRWNPTPEQFAMADRLIDLLGLSDRQGARWPTLSQDVAGREQLIERIDALQHTYTDLASVLVTHHLEELPPGTTHVMLLRDGRCLASGSADEVLTGDQVSKCFDHPIRLTRVDGRWSVRANRPVTAQAG